MPHPLELLQGCPRGEPLALLFDGHRARLCTGAIEALTLPAGAWRGAFGQLDEFLRRHRDRVCAGWLGYDLGLDVEAWPLRLDDDFPVPVLHVAAYRDVVEFASVPLPPPPPLLAPAKSFAAHGTRADYEERVAAVVEHICAGDLFQANLTQPFTGHWQGEPRELFWRLCAQSPAPFAAYLEDGEGTAVVSSSPEEFLWRDGEQVRTRPIKGTRPRSDDPVADAALLRELLASEKDIAELAMIVDLLRNDLGKVAATGTVQVGPFPEHASFAQVHHLFATVTARLRPGTSHVDLLRATFPGGSVTGCPKLRCLQILEQLEVARRGLYTGAIGSFGPGDRLHLNIAIRTLVCRDGAIRANAGGGITAPSVPAREWEETMHKLSGIERALQRRAAIPGRTA